MRESLKRLLDEARGGDEEALEALAVELRRQGYGQRSEPWEYHVIEIPTLHSPVRHAEVLTERGLLGWALDRCHVHEGHTYYILRRHPQREP